MKRWIQVAFIASAFASGTSNAGRIADLLAERVLGTKWGDTAETVASTHPGGWWTNTGKLKTYSVKDARQVLGVDRGKRSVLMFGFTSDGLLSSVTVTYPGGSQSYGQVLMAATEAFGQPLTSKDEHLDFKSDFVAATGVRWAEDSKVSVLLNLEIVGFTSSTNLIIMKTGVAGETSKSDLGLN